MSQEPFFITRNVKVTSVDQALLDHLNRHQGIKEAQRLSDAKIAVTYDLTQLDFEDVYALLDKVKTATNWFTRLKHGYWTMSDQNLRANLKVPAHCCNKAPR